jgi:beta-lactamase regulating signal transducer with metallopeptidase domain
MTIVFAWLWQGMLVALIAAVLVRAMPGLNAATRHVIWWVALAAVLAIPLVLWADTAGAIGASMSFVPMEDADTGQVVLPAVPHGTMGVLWTTWSCFTTLAFVRLVRSWRAGRALAQHSVPVDASRESRLAFWSAERTRARRRAELRISDGTAGACVVGFVRPTILVGRRLASTLGNTALDQIVLHEQAHVVRRDDWLHLLQALVHAVTGLHPAVRWLLRRIDADREAACDDFVVARTGGAAAYASALVQAASAAGKEGILLAPGAASGRSSLHARVVRLLDPRRSRSPEVCASRFAFVALALAGIVLLVSPRFDTTVLFAEIGVVENASRVDERQGAAVIPALREPSQLNEALHASNRTAPERRRDPIQGRVPAPVHEASVGFPTPAARSGQTASAPPSSEPVLLEGGVLAGMRSAQLTLPPIAKPSVPPNSPQAGGWQTFAQPSAGLAKNTAAVVASGATKTGLSLGRAFTRAAKGIANSF